MILSILKALKHTGVFPAPHWTDDDGPLLRKESKMSRVVRVSAKKLMRNQCKPFVFRPKVLWRSPKEASLVEFNISHCPPQHPAWRNQEKV